MTCRCEEDGHISGSWQFGFSGQMCLLFDSENGHWTVVHSGGRRMREKWEKDRAVSNFFKKVSMGDCRAWLRDFLVRWEEMLPTTGAHSLCLDLTIKSQSKSGQPWCQVQGSVDTKPFLQYDSDRNKVKPLGFLGKEVNDTKVWTELSQTLAEAGKELKMVLPFIKLDKKEMRVQPTAPGISPITWIAARVLTIFVIMGIVAYIHYKKRFIRNSPLDVPLNQTIRSKTKKTRPLLESPISPFATWIPVLQECEAAKSEPVILFR
ncbi:hypothetical protein MJG53_009095 [Ovis ammon polii x Ovis aries]|uniref:Uncharacterized protein n=1 Tax=Ovis ammon polii x Ovis aries TaxID=2918886 RepID=A0ACB9UXY8_9CETA|nr:hypothetical protein MJG53_009095 [Ovis ammon polii x Ovis aries]